MILHVVHESHPGPLRDANLLAFLDDLLRANTCPSILQDSLENRLHTLEHAVITSLTPPDRALERAKHAEHRAVLESVRELHVEARAEVGEDLAIGIVRIDDPHQACERFLIVGRSEPSDDLCEAGVRGTISIALALDAATAGLDVEGNCVFGHKTVPVRFHEPNLPLLLELRVKGHQSQDRQDVIDVHTVVGHDNRRRVLVVAHAFSSFGEFGQSDTWYHFGVIQVL